MKHEDLFKQYSETRERVRLLSARIRHDKAEHTAMVQREESRIAGLERELVGCRSELVRLSNEIPKLLHADVSGVLGKQLAEPSAEPALPSAPAE